MLKATRIVLVDHMDEVLREALCLPDPDALFGPRRALMEYRDGELYVRRRAVARRRLLRSISPPRTSRGAGRGPRARRAGRGVA